MIHPHLLSISVYGTCKIAVHANVMNTCTQPLPKRRRVIYIATGRLFDSISVKLSNFVGY